MYSIFVKFPRNQRLSFVFPWILTLIAVPSGPKWAQTRELQSVVLQVNWSDNNRFEFQYDLYPYCRGSMVFFQLWITLKPLYPLNEITAMLFWTCMAFISRSWFMDFLTFNFRPYQGLYIQFPWFNQFAIFHAIIFAMTM